MSDQHPVAIDFTVGRPTITSLYDGILRHGTSDLLRGIPHEAMPGLLQVAGIGQDLVQDVNALFAAAVARCPWTPDAAMTWARRTGCWRGASPGWACSRTTSNWSC